MLSDEKKNIFFLLKIKCPVVAAHSGFKIGTHALVRICDPDNLVKP